MRAFITGATGFVGSQLCKRLVSSGHSVVTLVRDFPLSDKKWLLDILSKSVIAVGDVRDFKMIKRIIAQYDIDTVFHLASQAIVRRAMNDPINTYESNIMGTVNILEACRDTDVNAILVTSTDKVYGELPVNVDAFEPPSTFLYKEDFALNGLGVYESSKVCMDIISRAYAYNYELPVVVSRACNIYGPGDSNPRIIPNTIRACLRGENPVIFKGVKYRREYIYIEDVLGAYLELAENIDKTKGKAYNVGSRKEGSQEDIVLKILKHFPELEPKYEDPKPYMEKEITEQMLDSSRIWVDLRWKAKVELDEGIERTVEWWKEWMK